MITYRTETAKVKNPNAVTCDVCKHSWFWDSVEVGEFEFIRRMGGYGSVFGDEYLVELDICQHCLKKMIGRYVDEKGLSSNTI